MGIYIYYVVSLFCYYSLIVLLLLLDGEIRWSVYKRSRRSLTSRYRLTARH